MDNDCGCSGVINSSTNCPGCLSEDCVFTTNSECVVLSVDLPNLNINQSQGLDEALTAIDNLILGSVLQKKITIPSANVLTLDTIPYQLLAPPGVGKFYTILSIQIGQGTGNTVYTVIPGQLSVLSSTGAGAYWTIGDGILNTLDTSTLYSFVLNSSGDLVINDAVVLIDTTALTLGDFPINVYISYQIKSV